MQSDNLYCAGSVNSISDLLVYLMGNFYNPTLRAMWKTSSRLRYVDGLNRRSWVRRSSESIETRWFWMSRCTCRKNSPSPSPWPRLQRHSSSRANLNAPLPARRGHYTMAILAQPATIRAESLLRTTNLSITEVAAEVGMVDSAHFARQFKKVNRLSPSEYRKAVKGKVFSPI